MNLKTLIISLLKVFSGFHAVSKCKTSQLQLRHVILRNSFQAKLTISYQVKLTF